ncbi:unnamed protein product, partial [Phaeothamnion confervicola]
VGLLSAAAAHPDVSAVLTRLAIAEPVLAALRGRQGTVYLRVLTAGLIFSLCHPPRDAAELIPEAVESMAVGTRGENAAVTLSAFPGVISHSDGAGGGADDGDGDNGGGSASPIWQHDTVSAVSAASRTAAAPAFAPSPSSVLFAA